MDEILWIQTLRPTSSLIHVFVDRGCLGSEESLR